MKTTIRCLLVLAFALGLIPAASAHYDPRVGRFLSRDPLGEEGGFNLYAYCGNDPVNRHDPLGLDCIVHGSDGRVYWVVEEDGFLFFNSDKVRVPIGRLNGTTVQFGAEFGGGIGSLGDLSGIADKFWRQYPDISGLPLAVQQRYVGGAIDRVRRGNPITTDSTVWGYTKAAGGGLKIGAKANVNALANTGYGLVTLGFGDRVEPWAVTDYDRSYAYDFAEGSGRVGFEILSGVLTGGMSNAKWTGKAQYVAKGAFAWDMAGNVVGFGRGTYHTCTGGLTWGSGIEMFGGLAGFGGNLGGLRAIPKHPPLAHVFDGHAPGQGFTAVWDEVSGELLAVPSMGQRNVPPLPGYLPRGGGHATVSARLGGDAAQHHGFALILQANGTFRVTWFSGTLNSAADGMVPASLRPTIIKAIEAATGIKVTSF